jgi:hypothetical protein
VTVSPCTVIDPLRTLTVPLGTARPALLADTPSISTVPLTSIDPERLLLVRLNVAFWKLIDLPSAAIHLPAEFDDPPPSKSNVPLAASTVPWFSKSGAISSPQLPSVFSNSPVFRINGWLPPLLTI